MQITGMLYGSKLLRFVGFPASEVLGPAATEEEIKGLLKRHGSIFVFLGQVSTFRSSRQA